MMTLAQASSFIIIALVIVAILVFAIRGAGGPKRRADRF